MIRGRWWLAAAAAAVTATSGIASSSLAATIPATPLMTLYQFNGPLAVPYHDAERFARGDSGSAAGSLTQGTSLVPCLVVRNGRPLTDGEGTPYVGFEVVVDAGEATPASRARFEEVAKQRKEMEVADHHCPPGTRYVIDVRRLYAMNKPPSFDPPRPAGVEASASAGRGGRDEIVRAFHASRHCEAANARLVGRREALRRAWDAFAAESRGRWPGETVAAARHLDFVMRTALYEGHLDRGCNAYGACERNVIALSIRNRGVERCLRGQGCRFPGDFEGVASAISQYNIWDEFLAQTSGLTSCFLRPDLRAENNYARLQAMYEQSVGDIERILFGSEGDLETVFPGNSLAQLKRLRHYYHPPAMGKCFPNHPRLEYMSGAVARRGDRFALIAHTRIEVGEKRESGYLFKLAEIEANDDRDVVAAADRYPGFVVDSRKVSFATASRCTPYGTSPSCRFDTIGRYRKTPSWLSAGQPLQLSCRVRTRGEDCRSEPRLETAKVGGTCDKLMQPVAGVP